MLALKKLYKNWSICCIEGAFYFCTCTWCASRTYMYHLFFVYVAGGGGHQLQGVCICALYTPFLGGDHYTKTHSDCVEVRLGHVLDPKSLAALLYYASCFVSSCTECGGARLFPQPATFAMQCCVRKGRTGVLRDKMFFLFSEVGIHVSHFRGGHPSGVRIAHSCGHHNTSRRRGPSSVACSRLCLRRMRAEVRAAGNQRGSVIP